MYWIGHNSQLDRGIALSAINNFIISDNKRVSDRGGRQFSLVKEIKDLGDGKFSANFWYDTEIVFQVKDWVACILAAIH